MKKFFSVFKFIVIMISIGFVYFGASMIIFEGRVNIFWEYVIMILVFPTFLICSMILDKFIKLKLYTKQLIFISPPILFFIWYITQIESFAGESTKPEQNIVYIARKIFNKSIDLSGDSAIFIDNLDDLELLQEINGRKYIINVYNEDTIQVESDGYICTLLLKKKGGVIYTMKEEVKKSDE